MSGRLPTCPPECRADAEVPHMPGTLDFSGEGLAGCCVCGWRGVPTVRAGQRSPVCPVCASSEVEKSEPRDLGLRAPAAASKVARNGPCPCGSGKKAKKCCHP